MSMRERREKIETLVQNDPRVQACAREFDESLSTITGWHAHNDALCATKAELSALADLITFNEFCLEDLKCAKTAAYNQLMSQYPRVWDTTCDDPFFYTTAQTTAPGDGVEREETATLPETEEMSAVPDRDVHKFADADEAVLHTTSHNPALRDWIEGLDHDTTPSDSTDHLTDAAHPTLHDMETDDLDGLRQAVQDMADGDPAAIHLISIGRREMARDIRKALIAIIYNIDHIATDLLAQETNNA